MTQNKNQVLGVILAGGLSKRMKGENKFFKKINNKTIIEHIIIKASQQVTKLIINANINKSKFKKFNLDIKNVILGECDLIFPGWIFLNNFGNTSAKNIPPSIAHENHIIKKCSPTRSNTIDIIRINIATKINRGKAFVCIFLKLNNPKRNSGMPIMAKK